MNKETCKNCAHYRRHYLLDNECCMPVNCGHCTYSSSRIKQRKPDSPACDHFVPQHGASLPNRDETIYFMTTEFLKKILEKPLPPKITEDEGFEYNKEAPSF